MSKDEKRGRDVYIANKVSRRIKAHLLNIYGDMYLRHCCHETQKTQTTMNQQ
jgi:hypothetical protein